MKVDILGGRDLTPTQPFGCTDYALEWTVPVSVCASEHFHTGIDLPCDLNDPVRTPRSGTVLRVGIEYLGDQAVGIRFGDGRIGVFGHLEKSLVAVGNRVQAGATIGLAGSRGHSSGVHLHFSVNTASCGETQPPGDYIDPSPYLTFQEDFMAALTDQEQQQLAQGVDEIRRAIRGGDSSAPSDQGTWLADKLAEIEAKISGPSGPTPAQARKVIDTWTTFVNDSGKRTEAAVAALVKYRNDREATTGPDPDLDAAVQGVADALRVEQVDGGAHDAAVKELGS